MSTIAQNVTVTGADQNQLADMLKQTQNGQQVKYLLTVANLLAVGRQDVEQLWRDGELKMETAEAIHRGAQVLNWKPFVDAFNQEPHVHAVAYWMANHLVNKRSQALQADIALLRQLMLELNNRLMVVEQKTK